MAGLPFFKYEAAGNDFVLLDGGHFQKDHGTKWDFDPEMIQRLCHRRLGIGCDQLIGLLPPDDDQNDARVRFFNADGSEAELCGNGLRAVALHLLNYSPETAQEVFLVETAAGAKRLWVNGMNAAERTQIRGSMDQRLTVDIGPPRKIKEERELSVNGNTFVLKRVDMGNPHAVILLKEDPDHLNLAYWGPQLENHPELDERCNVEFLYPTGENQVKVRVWERGTGETLACGSGACASAAAYIDREKAPERVSILMPGGELEVHWQQQKNSLDLTGPAREVFHGEYQL